MIFSYSSQRAKKARLAYSLNQKSWHYGLLFAFWASTVTGISLLLVSQPIGWFVASLAVLPAIFLIWHEGELRSLEPLKQSKTIDGVLAVDILGTLPKSPTLRSVATSIGTSSSGLFFAARFGITPRFLQDIASSQTGLPDGFWQDVWDLKEKAGVESIDGGLLIIAIMRTVPNYDMILAHLHISEDDLMSGVHWRNRIMKLSDRYKQPKRTGGIARDWSFGYTPLLDRFGQNISEQISKGGLLAVELESHVDSLTQIIDTFSAEGRQNIALVGPIGVGKTSIIYAFAEHLLDASSPLPDSLKFRQVFVLDAAALLADASKFGGIEKLVLEILGEAYSAKNIIICLDNAELFFENGVGSVDISNVLLPILEAGRLRVILTMDEHNYMKISSRNGAMANSLNRISIGPANKQETIAVMRDQLLIYEANRNVIYTYQSLDEAYRLSERYVPDLAQPGKAVRLLESSAGYAENGLVTINSVQASIEKTLGIKVGVASGEVEREVLMNLEDKIHTRMVNQSRAVEVVSSALRRARAGVRNTDRPIGTFLFLGPTGVGKTELAKSLADVYFGGEGRLIRVDLNEFVQSDDVARLIADGADDPMSLTSQIMKQPFSVVLLDEIEKAHPSVLTTLLQMLDEGILRDIKNREVSFRDAIVIATSNAGSDRIREYIDRGYKLEQFETKLIDELIDTNQFRPEFINRFDEAILFRPLEKAELLQVVDLIIAGLNKTLASQKISVEVEPEAKQLLVDKGYDPRLGARPLRRVVQRAVENTVAEQMLSGNLTPGSTVTISFAQVEDILGRHVAADDIANQSI